MTAKSFFNNITNGKEDILQVFLNLLDDLKIDYCIIGGLAVNAYVEPVVSLDLDIVITVDSKEKLMEAVKDQFSIEIFEHSINFTSQRSDIRIQLQTDLRYQDFINRARLKTIMGYRMMVASLEDVLAGKIWAYLDDTRRKSKRQKDLADIFRIIESYPHQKEKLPDQIRKMFVD